MAAPAHIARENGKKGGRPPGKKSKKTLEKEAALQEFQRRVREAINPLFESQMTIARGCTYLYYISNKRRDPQIVTDPEKIALYLKDELHTDKGEYYFISTERPDNKAIDSLLDRTFGKANQSIDLKADMKVATDDIRALIATLPDAERKDAYAFLARLIEQSKRPSESRKGATRKRQRGVR